MAENSGIATTPIQHNLPSRLNSFIGRERDLEELATRLTNPSPENRLITLTGVGGAGKTSLALQLASRLLPEFKDGVWLVELASLFDPTLLTSLVASLWQVGEQAGQPLLDGLIEFLRPKQLLLVLDNCEHLIDEAARLAESLLQLCPALRILATSRERLNIAGEINWQIPPLSLPENAKLTTLNPETLGNYEAVRLFVERAKAVQPNFTLTTSDWPLVVQLCQQLDGLPLAIELAAARVGMLTLEQLLSRVQDRFKLLSSGNRTAQPRQQTLRSLIDWSYDLLSPAEQLMLRRLAVFTGGWTLEAAEGVCAGVGLDPAEVLDLQQQLVDKSLVVAETPGQNNQKRYRLLETIRQYALNKLVEAGEEAATRNQHLSYFLNRAEAANDRLRGPEQPQWLTYLDQEYDNLRSALEWAIHGPVPTVPAEAVLRLPSALTYYWIIRLFVREGSGWVQDALHRPEAAAPTLLRARTIVCLGILICDYNFQLEDQGMIEEAEQIARAANSPSDIAAALDMASSFAHEPEERQRLLEESLAIYRELADKWNIARVMTVMGSLSTQQGAYTEGVELYEQSLALFQETGDLWCKATVLSHMGYTLGVYLANPEATRPLIEQSWALFAQLSSKVNLAAILRDMGANARNHGKYEESLKLLQESLSIVRETGMSEADMATTNGNLGYTYLAMGQYARAKPLLLKSLYGFREFNVLGGAAWCVEGLAEIALRLDQFVLSARLYTSAATLREAVKSPLPAIDRPHYQQNIAILRTKLAEPEQDLALATGRTTSLDQAIILVEELSLPDEAAPPSTTSKSSVSTSTTPASGLTTREHEVLRLVARGLTNAQVAEELVLSPLTVNAYLRSVYNKLNVSSRAAATRYALENNLV